VRVVLALRRQYLGRRHPDDGRREADGGGPRGARYNAAPGAAFARIAVIVRSSPAWTQPVITVTTRPAASALPARS
jgi:hypothetical protein